MVESADRKADMSLEKRAHRTRDLAKIMFFDALFAGGDVTVERMKDELEEETSGLRRVNRLLDFYKHSQDKRVLPLIADETDKLTDLKVLLIGALKVLLDKYLEVKGHRARSRIYLLLYSELHPEQLINQNLEALATYIVFHKISKEGDIPLEVWDLEFKEGRGENVMMEVYRRYKEQMNSRILELTNKELDYLLEEKTLKEVQRIVAEYLALDHHHARSHRYLEMYSQFHPDTKQ